MLVEPVARRDRDRVGVARGAAHRARPVVAGRRDDQGVVVRRVLDRGGFALAEGAPAEA